MISKRLRLCLIGSVSLHIVLIVVVTKTSSTAPVAMRAVDAFIVESPVTVLNKSQRTILPKAASKTQPQTKDAAQFKPIIQARRAEFPLAGHNIDTEATPPKKVLDLTPPQPVESMERAAVVPHSTATGSPPDRPEVKRPVGGISTPSGLNSGTEKVMLLGDAGSPRFIHRELPVYPFMARKLGKEGKVLLRLALDAQGKLLGVDTVEANGYGFAEAARSAIRKSTFTPAVRDGRTVSSQVLVSVKFILQ